MCASMPSFEAIYREYRPKIVRYMTGMVDAQEADDLAQATLMKVAEKLHEFRAESSLSTWIYRIAANVALDRLRQRAGQRVTVAVDAHEDEAAGDIVPPELRSQSAEATAERREMNACLREYVDSLPIAYRQVVALGELAGFSNAEIADITGLTVETVKIRLHRGRARLRARFETDCALGRDADNELTCERASPLDCH